MKKSVIIFIGIGVALALVLIGIFGVAPAFQDQKEPVTSIVVTNEEMVDNTIYLEWEGFPITVDLEWEVLPFTATNKKVSVTSNNEETITINQADILGDTVPVIVTAETSGRVTINALDGSDKSTYVDIVAISTATVSLGYDFDTNSMLLPQQGKYAIEGEKLVLFHGRSYLFDFGDVVFENETTVATMENSLITTNTTGSFAFKFTRGEETKVIQVEVVDYLLGFGFGGGYQNFITTTTGTSDTFINKNQLYEVGSSDVFKTNLLVTNLKGVAVNKFDKLFSLQEFNGTEYVAVENPYDYFSETVENRAWFNFAEAAVGKQLKLTITPKYSLALPRVMEFVVNDGVNVYSHQELDDAFEMKGLYEGVTVTKINIHNTIEVVVGDENKYTVGPRAGYLVNEFSYVDGTGPDAGKTGHIYLRDGVNKDTAVSVIGNYQTIDGSNIPVIVNNTGSEDLQVAGTHINVQSTMFRVMGVGTGEFSMKNLKVVGNTRTASGGGTGGPNLSGGMLLVFISTGVDNYFNNLHLSDGVAGLFFEVNHPVNYISDVTIKDTYNSAISVWGGNIEVYNSKISNTGGPSIQLIDHNDGFGEDNPDNDPSLVIDQFTLDNIENWVAGDEGWYVGMNISLLVSEMKTLINNAVDGYGKTIIKEVGAISYVNFRVFIQNNNPATSSIPTQGKITVVPSMGADGVDFQRPYNFYTNFAGQNYTYVGAVDANPANLEAENVEIVTAVPGTGAQITVFLEWQNK